VRQEAESENPTILRVTWLPSKHGGDFFPAEMTNIILPHYSSCAFLLSCSVTSLGVHTNCSSYISCFLFLAKRDYCFSNCNLLKYSCSAPTFFDMDLWKNNVYTVLPKDFFVRVCTPSIFHCYYIFFLPLILYLLSCFFLHLYRTFFFWTPQLIWPLKNQTQWRYYFVPTYELHFSCVFFFFFYFILKTLFRFF